MLISPEGAGGPPQQNTVDPPLMPMPIDPWKRQAIAALVLGIVSLVIGFTPLVGVFSLVLSILGIYFTRGIDPLAIWVILPLVGTLLSLVLSILGIRFSVQGRRSPEYSNMAIKGKKLSITALIMVPFLLICFALGPLLILEFFILVFSGSVLSGN